MEDLWALWLDELLIEIPARTTDEPRFLVIGLVGGKHFSAVITYREQRVRIISVQRSRVAEVALYEAEDFDNKFDAGGDVTGDLDLSKARRPNQEPRRVNVDFPRGWSSRSIARPGGSGSLGSP